MNDVTAMCLNRDEPTLIESVDSIRELVKRVVVVDASEDKALSNELRGVYSNVNVFDAEPNYYNQSLFAYHESDTRWVLRWDADFIATESTLGILDLTARYETGKHCIAFNVQHEHGKSAYSGLHREPYLFVKSPSLFKLHLKRIYANLFYDNHSNPWAPFPLRYNHIVLDVIGALHKDVKPLWRVKEHPAQRILAVSSRTGKWKL